MIVSCIGLISCQAEKEGDDEDTQCAVKIIESSKFNGNPFTVAATSYILSDLIASDQLPYK